MQTGKKLSFVLTMAALAFAPGVHAQVFCGDVLVGGTHTMTADITGCAIDPAVTLDGARLDMDGFEISGCAAGDGVFMTGGSSRLENGSVSGCQNGVVLDTGGAHRVEYLRSGDHSESAFYVQSPGARLLYVRADNSAIGIEIETGADLVDVDRSSSVGNTEGMVVRGDKAVVENTVVALSSGVGITVDGDRSKFYDVALFESPIVVNGDRNRFKYMLSVGGLTAVGAEVTGEKNKIERSQIHNYGTGVKLAGIDNDVRHVVVAGGSAEGIGIPGLTRNDVRDSFVTGNAGDGIAVLSGAGDTTVRSNVSTGNSGSFDLRDDNAGCGTNDWINNVEDTTNDPCVD